MIATCDTSLLPLLLYPGVPIERSVPQLFTLLMTVPLNSQMVRTQKQRRAQGRNDSSQTQFHSRRGMSATAQPLSVSLPWTLLSASLDQLLHRCLRDQLSPSA
jgi:hypothetical protein